MRIVNAKLFYRGGFLPGGVEFGETITRVGPTVTGEGRDAGGCYLIPGLIDIHTHGAVGADASDGDSAGLERLSRYYAAGGVTAWCPTTMTLQEPELRRAMTAIRDFRRRLDGARLAGVNLEGPFLCAAKRGAQALENLHTPDLDLFLRLNDASGGQVRLVTVAPEVEGALDFIRGASQLCTVSLGHTAADYDTALAAYDAGASHTTHLFNAMPPLHHRAPGVIAAAADAGATAELITDGLHVHPAMVRLAHRIFREKLVLISDSLRCAGMPDGDYTLGGQPITMTGGKATLSGTDTLAGSSIHLLDGLRRAVAFGVPLEDAVAAATVTPAKLIRREGELGSLEPGRYADFLLLDEQLDLKAVYIGGRQIHSN
ncbi:MAG: N-acetylglucosamine-6-phosphate deacetylase [Clostridiales bacterium]|nr:N-acetylglucosamine-6-phosphate deacetylase [Clostridiales bacterium]